jgi:glutaredoxin
VTQHRRVTVVVYTRRGCGLCRDAEQLATIEARSARIRTVDIDQDAVLQERYGVRVPVVEVDGTEVAELEVRPGQIRRAVRRARRRSRTPFWRRRPQA